MEEESTESIMKQITTPDGKKVDINKFQRFTLKKTSPFRYKLLVLNDWLYGLGIIGFIWFIVTGHDVKGTLILFLVLALIWIAIFKTIVWIMDRWEELIKR